MPARGTDIDRWIEEGLAKYGQGDLDAALEVWERVLAIEPQHAQATSYVDYVRLNYDLLRGEEITKGGADDSAPFAIGNGEPEYFVEITTGDLPSAGRAFVLQPILDAIDEGWALDEEPTHRPPMTITRTISADLPPLPGETRTISADLPPLELEMEADAPPEPFEDATREYWKGRPPTRDIMLASDAPNEFLAPQVTPGFGSSADLNTPTGFGQQLTGVRKRELGFVKPTGTTTISGTGTAGPAPAIVARSQGPVSPPKAGAESRSKRASVVPELKMTLRTPEIPPNDAPPLAAVDTLQLELDEAFKDPSVATLPARTPAHISHEMPVIESSSSDELELGVAGASTIAASVPEPSEEDLFSADRETKDLPSATFRDVALELAEAGRHTTKDLPAPARVPAPGSKPPPNVINAPFTPPITSLPTRDLGLRPPSMRLPTEEETTSQRTIPRPPVVASPVTPARRPVVAEPAPIDLIDTTVQLILDAVDRDTPDGESAEDRTRRRIQGLLERASEWSTSEPEKAVAAVELALDQDPTSALAQKLVHRNRDAIMGVFQGYLGDMQRQPTLARPMSELAGTPISPRAAFLLSRIDGMLSLDEILDVSGMPRLEAYRYLSQLFLRGILK